MKRGRKDTTAAFDLLLRQLDQLNDAEMHPQPPPHKRGLAREDGLRRMLLKKPKHAGVLPQQPDEQGHDYKEFVGTAYSMLQASGINEEKLHPDSLVALLKHVPDGVAGVLATLLVQLASMKLPWQEGSADALAACFIKHGVIAGELMGAMLQVPPKAAELGSNALAKIACSLQRLQSEEFVSLCRNLAVGARLQDSNCYPFTLFQSLCSNRYNAILFPQQRDFATRSLLQKPGHMPPPGGPKKNQRATVTLQEALKQRDSALKQRDSYECEVKQKAILLLQTEEEMYERIAFLNGQARDLVGELKDNKIWKKTAIMHMKKCSAQLDEYDKQLKNECAENARLRATIKDMKAAQDCSDSSDYLAPLSSDEDT